MDSTYPHKSRRELEHVERWKDSGPASPHVKQGRRKKTRWEEMFFDEAEGGVRS